jgi:hypothetical protein
VAVILTSMAYCVKGSLQLPPDAVVNENSPRLVASLNLKMRTHTKFFNFSKLAIADGASAVVRVAMVCNDLATANSSLGHFKNLPSNALSHVRQGGALYSVRMSCGHLREGIKAIREIRNDAALSALVRRCDTPAQSAFAELCECLPAGKHHAEFQRYVPSVRDKTAFHYDTAEIKEALEFRTKHHSNSPCAVTIGEDAHSCRFDFADIIIDTIVCRKLFAIPIAADAHAEADRIADWCCTKTVEFLTFGGDFVTRFLQEHA